MDATSSCWPPARGPGWVLAGVSPLKQPKSLEATESPDPCVMVHPVGKAQAPSGPPRDMAPKGVQGRVTEEEVSERAGWR